MAEKTLRSNDHIIPLEGVTNARDLGGYINRKRRRIKSGKLLRTGQLYTATERDIKTLRENYNVGTIIDFRSGYETILHSDPNISGAKYHNLPVLEFKRSEEEQEKLMKVYAEKKYGKRLLTLAEAGITADTGVYARIMFGESAKAAYKSFFELLLENDEEHSVLFHCTQGKDRTGIAAALLLTLLDIPEEVIMEDYLLTNNANSHIIRADIAAVPHVIPCSLNSIISFSYCCMCL